MQLAVHLGYSFKVSNCNMAGNSVEKHSLVVLNVKLQVKCRFKTVLLTFITYIKLSSWTSLSIRFFLLKIFA